MEKLLSNWYNVRPVPENYIFPPEQRPGNVHVPIGEGIPVIDLSEAENCGRTLTIQKILKAAQDFGFFQVQAMVSFPILCSCHKISSNV
ncbi:hypothetical protein K1719_009914 [Acacia pycnantha]|nr:hypothetical protein K1719_009914 [Acacia pycnantha]